MLHMQEDAGPARSAVQQWPQSTCHHLASLATRSQAEERVRARWPEDAERVGARRAAPMPAIRACDHAA